MDLDGRSFQPAIAERSYFTLGDNPGYKTAIVRYIDSDNTIIVLSNNASDKINSIVSFIQKQLDQ